MPTPPTHERLVAPGVAHAADRDLVDALLRRLDLETAGKDRFRGLPGRGEGRVFGGMLVAQGLVAAGRTVRDALPHALHAHFLRAGRQGLVVEWDVERVRDGRRFVTRRVVGRQAAATIFLLTASFTRAQEGLAHQDPMPTVLPPEIGRASLGKECRSRWWA